MGRFSLGKTIISSEVCNLVETNKISTLDIATMISNHNIGEWGTVSEITKLNNEDSIINKNSTILSRYVLNDITFWVLTEYDHSVTTVLLPHER